MSIPAAVEILGKTYRVEQVEGEQRDYGECYVDECRIEVWSKPCHDQKADTLLHEVLHAIDHEMHCSMSEPQIRRMTTGTLAVLRRNPQLVAYLLGSE